MRTETCQKSLYERAVEAEHRRHASRLKELRAGQKKLALLGSIEPQLNAANRCDACGARAWVRATMPSGGQLYFCGHHAFCT